MGDATTVNTSPTIEGSLPDGFSQGDEISILVNGAPFATVAGETSSDGLEVDYDDRSWRYTPQPPLAAADHRFVVLVKDVPSSALIVTIKESIVTVIEQPTLVQASAFDDGDNLEVRVEADAEAAVVSVSWDGGPSVDALFNAATGEWTAVFSRAQMEAMADGAAARFTVTAKDARDNILAVTQSDDVGIELVNQAPVSNDAHPIGLQLVAEGVIGGIGGTPILDLADLNGDESGNAAFTDEDEPDSDNASLSYTLTLAGGEPAPSWLEITRGGVLQVVEGMAMPALDAPVNVTVTATDKSGGMATRDIRISSLKTPDLAAEYDSGQSDTDNLTAVKQPQLSGTVPAGVTPGATIKIYQGEGAGEVEVASVVGNGSFNGLDVNHGLGTWTYTPPAALTDGSHEFKVVVDGTFSSPLIVEVDTLAEPPVLLDIPAIVIGHPAISGTAEPHATVTVMADDGSGGVIF